MGQPQPATRRETSLLPAVAVVLGVLVLRLLYLRFACPYDLVEDEAQYWLWSRFPDWSYYSKGPGVAWVIWLAGRVLGDAEWAVRAPSAVLAALGGVCAAGLTRDLAAHAWARLDEQRRAARATPSLAAVFAALAFSLAPALQMAGVLMTIDGPYVACWAAAAWAAWRASMLGQARLWAVVGAAIGAGFLFKYTMLLLLPGLVLWTWHRRRGSVPAQADAMPAPPRPASSVWLAAGAGLAMLGLLPVLVWNSQNGWLTWAHLLGHLGLKGGDMPVPASGSSGGWSPLWLPEFAGQQLGMIGPVLVLAAVAAIKGWRASRKAARSGVSIDPRWAGQGYLLWCAGPILVFYALVSLMAEPEGNWPMAAHATLVPLGAWWAADALAARREARRAGRRHIRGARGLWHATIVYGVVAAALTHRADLAAAALAGLNAVPAFRSAFVGLVGREPRDFALGRLMGAAELARGVGVLMDDLERQTGRRPIIIAQHYGRASQMAYYLRDREPVVLCVASLTGGRRSQFDLWAHASPWRVDLGGRPGVALTSDGAHAREFLDAVFARVEAVPGSERIAGEHKAGRRVYLGFEYRPPPARAEIDRSSTGARR